MPEITPASALAEHAKAIRTLGRRATVEIGRHLTEAKKLCGHGNWLPWLEREFGWTDRTALNYMRVHELSLKSETVSDLDLLPMRSLYELAAPKTPPEVREDVFDRARDGERLTHAEIKTTIDKSRDLARVERAEPGAPMVVLKTHDGRDVLYPKPAGKPKFNETNEQISWAKWSWNPVTGCLHACQYCYAREIALRFPQTFPAGFDPLFHPDRLSAPANTEVPSEAEQDPRWRRVFVCSMADLYGKWVPDEWIEQVHQSCIDNPQWDYLMLTKFPRRYVGLNLPKTAWLGTSVDEQKRVRLAEEAFRQIQNVRVKWLSLEPLLAPLQFTDLSMFDWIVIGAQSATNQPDGLVPEFAPPFKWVARLVDQATEAGCRVYLKPNLLGAPNPQSPGMQLLQEEPKSAGPRLGPRSS
jgi:protein gp37